MKYTYVVVGTSASIIDGGVGGERTTYIPDYYQFIAYLPETRQVVFRYHDGIAGQEVIDSN